MFFRAWALVIRNLLYYRTRLALSILGVGFAVVLMFMQIGFRNALFDSTVQLVRELNADLILFSKGKYALTVTERIPRTRLLQAASDPGVRGAYPLYVDAYAGVWKRRQPRVSRPIRVLAFQLNDPVFTDDDVRQQLDPLRQPHSALLDRLSKRKSYGLPADLDALTGMPVELLDQELKIVGTFSLGTDFANDGNLLMSAENYARYFGRAHRGDPLDRVDLGVIQLVDPAQAQAVKDRLAAVLPEDTRVLTKQEFIDREIRFWQASTPIGYVFFVGLMMGWIVGFVICYQIISRDISDHIGEYATLKAMGYRKTYFVGIVFWQAVSLSIVAFLPGMIVSFMMYYALSEWTGLLMILTFPRAAQVFVLTLLLCASSGAWAIRGLLQSDPASLF